MKLSLTELVDIVAKAGARKARQVSLVNERHEQDYSVAKDFYKPLRDEIVSIHKSGAPKERLAELLDRVKDKKKLGRYRLLVPSYQQWWGRNQLSWIAPSAGLYVRNSIVVSVNPEIAFRLRNGESLVVKMYFKSERLDRTSADLITSLMATSLGRTDVAVLDIERRKVFLPPKDIQNKLRMVDAELAYIAQFMRLLDEAA